MSYRQIFTQTTQQGSQDSYNLKADKGLQIEDMPHVINVLMSYRLPVGRGQRFLGNTNPVVNHVLGNWTFAMDGQYRSGALLQELNPTSSLQSELFSTLTKVTSTGLPVKSGQATNSLDPGMPTATVFNQLTKAPYVQTAAFKLGTASYYNNQVRAPWIRTENMSLNKQFKIWESVLLNYSINVFNPFNRTDFGGIVSTITANNYGHPTAAQVGARVITMGARLEF